MNKPAVCSLFALILAASTGCEQQSYEETKMFNQSNKPGSHGHGDHAAAADHQTDKPAAHGAAEKH
jgi:hypothetical protein